jgi:hypothetical protein
MIGAVIVCPRRGRRVTLASVSSAAHNLDRGVRAAVELLNGIDGVTTRASCEGGSEAAGHRHSDLAYVAFAFPLPARLQSHLVAELDMIARVEDDAVYCRWPDRNRDFLARLTDSVRRYKRRERRQRREAAECVLGKLRSRLAARIRRGQEVKASLCLRCRDLILAPHPCAGPVIAMLDWPADLSDQWFGKFLEEPGNALEASLRSRFNDAELEARARRGDFGEQFRRRWLRHRGDRTYLQMIQGLRAGIQRIRQSGADVDVCFDARGARFTWGVADKPMP